jgi:hypothetical protein
MLKEELGLLLAPALQMALELPLAKRVVSLVQLRLTATPGGGSTCRHRSSPCEHLLAKGVDPNLNTVKHTSLFLSSV